MTHALRFPKTGGPEVLQWDRIEVPPPGPGEVLLRHTAIGVNFLDTYHRAGTHHVKLPLPGITGSEGVGIVEAVGTGVTSVKPGQRAVYPLTAGAYAERRIIPETDLATVPDGLADDALAATFMKGLTAGHLLFDIARVKPGDVLLMHAAAGGVGLLLGQWAKALGCVVIGTASTATKADLARQNGYAHVIDYTREDFVGRVKDITAGGGVRAVFDGVGATTFLGSLQCAKAPDSVVASFGLASGPLPRFGFADLPPSVFVTRATVKTVTSDRLAYLRHAARFFAALGDGTLRAVIGGRYTLRDGAEAHRALESRRTTGSLVLLP